MDSEGRGGSLKECSLLTMTPAVKLGCLFPSTHFSSPWKHFLIPLISKLCYNILDKEALTY